MLHEVETHNDVLQVEADGSNPETSKRMPQKPEMIFWRISVNLIYRQGFPNTTQVC